MKTIRLQQIVKAEKLMHVYDPNDPCNMKKLKSDMQYRKADKLAAKGLEMMWRYRK